MQLHAPPDGRIFCGVSKSKQLELFQISSSASTSPQPQATANGNQKLLLPHAALRLHFTFFSFALGVVEGAALLFASVKGDAFRVPPAAVGRERSRAARRAAASRHRV